MYEIIYKTKKEEEEKEDERDASREQNIVSPNSGLDSMIIQVNCVIVLRR